MTEREAAMGRHPAGRHLTEVQDVEAVSLANSYSRMDEWHHDWSQRSRWTDLVVPVLGVVGLFVLVFGAAVLGEIAGGWPA